MLVEKWPRKKAVSVKAPLQWWANELTDMNTWKSPVILYFHMKNSSCTEGFTKGKFSFPYVVHPSLIIWVNDYKWVIVQVKASIMTTVSLDIVKLNCYSI